MSTWKSAWVIYVRSLRFTVRKPINVAFGLIQPLLYLTLFGPLLRRLGSSPGFDSHNTWSVFVPGLLVQQTVFASVFVGIGIIFDARAGSLDRMKMTAASPLGLLLGRIGRDVTVLLVQTTLLTAGAVVAGLRVSFGALALTFVLLAVVGLAVCALSYGVALRLRSEEAFGQIVNVLTLPVVLLSGVLLPMTLAPAWLSDLSKANPLTHVISGARALFTGQLVTGTTVAAASVAFAMALIGCWFGLRSVNATER
jgi:ABC-2 type transport system permease protein